MAETLASPEEVEELLKRFGFPVERDDDFIWLTYAAEDEPLPRTYQIERDPEEETWVIIRRVKGQESVETHGLRAARQVLEEVEKLEATVGGDVPTD